MFNQEEINTMVHSTLKTMNKKLEQLEDERISHHQANAKLFEVIKGFELRISELESKQSA